MNLKEAIAMAIEYIEGEAAALAACHCVDGEWRDEQDAKATYDEDMALAAELRRHAAIEYVAVQSVDMDRTSEHLVTDDLRAAIEASQK